MRRYVFSAVLFICAMLVVSGCAALFGSDEGGGFFHTLDVRVDIMPDDNEYPYCCTKVGFYEYGYSIYTGMDWLTCNDGDMGLLPTGEFRGWVIPANGEEFHYIAYDYSEEATFTIRLQRPHLSGIGEGDQVPVDENFTVNYVAEDGYSVQAWCEDDNYNSTTNYAQPDDGTYEGLDTTGLSGPGRIKISRFYNYVDIYAPAWESVTLDEGEIMTIVEVTWVE